MAKTIFYILVFLFIAYAAICLFYFLFQEKLIFVPLWRKRRGVPLALASEHEEIFLDAVEGGKLHAVHIRADQPRGCILYFHGNTGCISRWASIAEEFISFGLDVIVPDYRGYGKSTGHRTEEVLYSDALLWYKKVNAEFPANRICIYGRSLGSGVAAWLIGQVHPQAAVLETPYDNFINVAKHHTKVIPVKWFLRYTFHNDIHIRRIQSPVLIAHGTKDKVVPYIMGFRLYEAAKKYTDAEMVTIPGGRHSDLNGFPIFRNKLSEFFERHFPMENQLGAVVRMPLKRI